MPAGSAGLVLTEAAGSVPDPAVCLVFLPQPPAVMAPRGLASCPGQALLVVLGPCVALFEQSCESSLQMRNGCGQALGVAPAVTADASCTSDEGAFVPRGNPGFSSRRDLLLHLHVCKRTALAPLSSLVYDSTRPTSTSSKITDISLWLAVRLASSPSWPPLEELDLARLQPLLAR